MQRGAKAIRLIFLSSFLFFAHLALVMYINSTVLTRMVGSTATTTLYVLGACGSITLLFYLPRIVQKAGLVKTSLSIFILLALTLFVLGTATRPQIFVAVFVLYSALTATVWYCDDMFISHYAKEQVMGHVRGSYLTIINTAIAIMPVIAGAIAVHEGFSIIYVVAGCLLLLGAIVIASSQRHFIDRSYAVPDIKSAWQVVRQAPSLRRIIALNFLLQFFYAAMTIFSPLYLLRVMHLNWGTIGIIFSIMLTAFIVLQYPIGRWSDKVGEKKLLVSGLLIAGLSTLLFARLGSVAPTVIIITTVLFFTRVGISIFEVMAESYFFKQVTDSDEGIISIYRMMYPMAYILAPLSGWLVLTRGSFMDLFMGLGLLLLLGAAYALRLNDIR
jgi:MFS family permease